MRRLLALLIVLAGGFVLVAMFVAPNQPELRAWYQANACPTLDKLSPQICDAIRRGEAPSPPGDKT